jgi:predicted  nucleic acid-binding Zn-ribbon protein
MLFKCSECGKISVDIDKVLDGACECGSRRFQLKSDETLLPLAKLSEAETIRRDLHVWLDLNLDSMPAEDLSRLRVLLEVDKPLEVPRG